MQVKNTLSFLLVREGVNIFMWLFNISSLSVVIDTADADLTGNAFAIKPVSPMMLAADWVAIA